ncbi:hypothetical protein TRFO_36859 [Tritrichomonas foetus]|uniref:Uncharacterized protein n=1 Tax=Tritrichomonas foetus TaxID=1144522 RepID=A0A1J4JFD1_9EUKA|nr:hypothetical protein TRFO_36859 [Tritrichomonas foetus]|eukprot:OHS96999.1 hypothetical protein TRFO_36859 [Tritrichomonas foetus]
MRKRNLVNKTGSSAFQMNIGKEDDPEIDYTNFRMNKLPNYSSIKNIRPNFLLQTKKETTNSYHSNRQQSTHGFNVAQDSKITKNNDYSDYSESYYYSYSESEESEKYNPSKNSEVTEMNSLFNQLFEKFGNYENEKNAASKIEQNINNAEDELLNTIKEINIVEASIGPNANSAFWKIKQFFTELINFIDEASNIDFDDVKDEYLSLDNALEKVKSFQRLDPQLYKKCGFSESVQELFEFFAIVETNNFIFSKNSPLIDLSWVRAGWKWTEEFGNQDMVPKVFEQICVPILVNKLKTEPLQNENDFRMAFLHCIEILDYCNHKSVAEVQLFGVLKARLESAFGTGKLKYKVYNQMMINFGFKKAKIWET